MENTRIRPNYEVPIVRDTASLVIRNKKGVAIYRASGKLCFKRRAKPYKAVRFAPRKVPYEKKSDFLRIYQLFHDQDSFHNCFDTEYITRLSLNPDFVTDDNSVLLLKDIKHMTNQISETRAFLYVDKLNINCQYVGFTSHRHDHKFFMQDRGIPITHISPDIVKRCFDTFLPVKMISFRIHPAHDFIGDLAIADQFGTINFLRNFFKDCYHFDDASYLNLIDCMQGKLFPYCNSFIIPRNELRDYVSYLYNFLDWADFKYGLDKTNIAVNRCKRSYAPNRGWGYICEQLPWYYLTFKYMKNFVIAFIDDTQRITYHDRIGYGVEG